MAVQAREIVHRAVLAVLLAPPASTVAIAPARADIVTWVDESGALVVTNETPPPGVQTHVIVRGVTPAPAHERDSASERTIESLSERVRRLEGELAGVPARVAMPPPPVPYPAYGGTMPPPDYVPPPAPPTVALPAAVDTACYDPWSCWNGWGSPYPGAVFVQGRRFPGYGWPGMLHGQRAFPHRLMHQGGGGVRRR